MQQPKKLALLVSLIGAGFSSYACARSETWIGRAPRSALDTALALPAATAVDRTRWATGFAWRPEDEPLDLPMPMPMPLEGLRPLDLWKAEWAPGELADEAQPAEAREPLLGRVERLPEDSERDDAQSDTEAEPLAPGHQQAKSTELKALPNEPGLSSPTAVLTDAHAAHTVRLMDTHATVVLDDEAAMPGDPALPRAEQAASLWVEPAIADAEFLAADLGAAAIAPPTERREIIVATESGKVLRTLEAILSGERDEVGAIPGGGRELVVATHSEKVLQELEDLLSARAYFEADSARRARSLAAPPATAAAREVVELDIDLSAAPADSESKVRPSPFGGEKVAVSEASLEGVRGGFTANGLNISFGIERAVYVNGALVATTSLNVSDLGRVTGGRGTTSFDAGTIALIQNGMGSVVTSGAISSTSIGTVVQNTLDGQKIQNVTVVNASVSSLGVLRGLNLQSSMRSAVIDSLRR